MGGDVIDDLGGAALPAVSKARPANDENGSGAAGAATGAGTGATGCCCGGTAAILGG